MNRKPPQDRPLRVVHILTDSNIGGAGRQLLYLAGASDRSKFEFIFILPTSVSNGGFSLLYYHFFWSFSSGFCLFYTFTFRFSSTTDESS